MDSQRFYMDSNLDSAEENKERSSSLEELTEDIQHILSLYDLLSLEDKIILKKIMRDKKVF